MDIDTTRDEYRAYNLDGFYTICKLEYDAAGVVVAVSGPAFPQAADIDGLRTQLNKMQQAFESPTYNEETLKRLHGDSVKVNLNDGAATRSEEDIEKDGSFSGSSEVPHVRGGLKEELTTRAAQAAQHIAEATGVEPALAVSFVPNEPEQEVLQEAGEEVAEAAAEVLSNASGSEPPVSSPEPEGGHKNVTEEAHNEGANA